MSSKSANAGDGGAGGAPQSLFARRRLRLLYLAAITLAVLALAYRLREALNPFLLALLIAYILNPAVQLLERRAHLPRTAAILLIYAMLGTAIGAASAYSIGRTLVGVDKIVTKIAGGWQIAPRPPAPESRSWWSTWWSAPTVEAPKRIPGFPIYGDDDIVENPLSPILGFIDVNQNRTRDSSEPEFTREGGGRWRPTDEFAPIVRRVPGYLDDIRERLGATLASANIDRKLIEEVADRAQSGAATLASAGGSIWRWTSDQVFGGLLSIVLYIVLVPVYAFFLLRGFDSIVTRIHEVLPGLHRERIESICRRIDRACAAFFRGRFLVCIGKAAAIWLGLYLVGVEFSLTIGVIVGALSLIPAVGPIVGMALAIVCAYAPDGGWANRIVGSGIVLAVAEALEAIVNPLFLGREVGLHPVTLLIALFMFGDLFGFFGVLLAVPLAAIAKILGQEFVLPELRHLAAERPGSAISGLFPAVKVPPPAVEVPPPPVELERK